MSELAKITQEELNKALAGQKNELKSAIENLSKNYQTYIEGHEKLVKENEEITKVADTVAENCLELTQIIKDVHIWLGSNADKFTEDITYHALMTGLANFVTGSQAIKAGVISNARA